MWFWTLRVINDDWVAAWEWFWKHPHKNMEIITIPLSWALKHQDSMGNYEELPVWEVQSMSAGSWVLHSEMNASDVHPVEHFQIWILTRKDNIAPQYSQKSFSPEKRINTWQLLAWPDSDWENVLINQDAYISRAILESWKTLNYRKYNSSNGVYLMNIDGSIQVWENILEKRDAIWILWNEEIIISPEIDSDILLLEVPM